MDKLVENDMFQKRFPFFINKPGCLIQRDSPVYYSIILSFYYSIDVLSRVIVTITAYTNAGIAAD